MENTEVITSIVKRDGTTQSFDPKKTTKEVSKEVSKEANAETVKTSK